MWTPTVYMHPFWNFWLLGIKCCFNLCNRFYRILSIVQYIPNCLYNFLPAECDDQLIKLWSVLKHNFLLLIVVVAFFTNFTVGSIHEHAFNPSAKYDKLRVSSQTSPWPSSQTFLAFLTNFTVGLIHEHAFDPSAEYDKLRVYDDAGYLVTTCLQMSRSIIF